MATFTEDIHVVGALSADSMTLASGSVSNTTIAAGAAIARSKLAQSVGKFVVPWMDHRIHDSATNAQLPNTAATDDLELKLGTFGTSTHSIQTGDLKAAGATTRYSRFQFSLPPEYDTGETVTIRAYAGMITTVSDTTAKIDFSAYESDNEAGVGSDLVTTSATTINSLTFANVDFTVNPTALVAGDTLDIRMDISVNDGATGTAVIGCVGWLAVLCDIRG